VPRPAHDTRAQPPAGEPPAVAPEVAPSNRVLTVPNLISFARLLGVPVFLYLFLGPQAEVAAIVVLAVGGTSDWIDGYVARRLHQVSRLGELLDPLADRLYILATLLAFTLREVVPWQFTAALLLRELVVAGALAALRRFGYVGLPVHYLGKTATFILLFAFPVLLLAHSVAATADVAGAIGWGLAWWGLVLYWAAGALYLVQAAALARAARSRDDPEAGRDQGPVGA
jgi:cardiolipin synthase (CMP-forming)